MTLQNKVYILQALFKLYKHEKIFLKILAIYNYITIIINEGGGNKKQTKTNSSNLLSSLKIRYYISIKALQTLIDLCESIPFNRTVQKYKRWEKSYMSTINRSDP